MGSRSTSTPVRILRGPAAVLPMLAMVALTTCTGAPGGVELGAASPVADDEVPSESGPVVRLERDDLVPAGRPAVPEPAADDQGEPEALGTSEGQTPEDEADEHLRAPPAAETAETDNAELAAAEPTPAPAPPAPAAVSTAPPASAPAAPVQPEPTRVVIPRIGVSHPMVPVGLHPDRTLVVPDEAHVSGWYTGAPRPGQVGPSIITGHNQWKGSTGVFWRLHELAPGDVVEVHHDTGEVVQFTVDRLEQHPKVTFPTQHVYGNTVGPELRIITCGGAFDRQQRSHVDNVIVFASRTG